MSPDITRYPFDTVKGAQNHPHLRTMAVFFYPKVTGQINGRTEMETQKV